MKAYTKYTVKILEHEEGGFMSFGVVEAQYYYSINKNYFYPQYTRYTKLNYANIFMFNIYLNFIIKLFYISSFTTDNKLYNYYGAASGKTQILYDMPK